MNLKPRIKRLFANCEEKVGIIALRNGVAPHIDQSFFYVTGLTNGLFEGATALAYPDGHVELHTNPLEEESAKKSACMVKIYRTRKDALVMLEKSLRGHKKIGVNFDEIAHRDFLTVKKAAKKAKLVNVSAGINKSRAIKDADEIARIRRACDIASAVARKIPSFLGSGVVEYEVGARISYEMARLGAEENSFATICSFGPNSAEPHYSVGERKLKKGDFVVCDYGARYRKYCSDITRTFVRGKATPKHREIYGLVSRLQTLALDEVRAGTKGMDVQKLIEETVAKTKYRGKFTHGIGHGLGLSVHDGVGFTSPPDVVLQEGMVLTVEPGIYLPGWGGVRIEDNVVVKKNGYEMLTTAPRELVEV